jgi:hypothetical protein
VYGDRCFQVLRLFGTTVHVNLESIGIMLATALAGRTLLESALIVACFALAPGCTSAAIGSSPSRSARASIA